MCQDTGTAIVMGKRGQRSSPTGSDEEHLARGVYDAYTQLNLRYSQMAPLTMWDEKNTGSNLPAQIELYATDGDAYKFLFMAKGGGSANKSYLYQETKAVLNPARMASFLEEKIRSIGTSACPPYHLAIVVGGTSAEFALKTAKYASARYLDTLPTAGRSLGHGFRDLELEQTCSRSPGRSGSARSSAASTSATTCASSGCPGTARPARWRSRCRARPTGRRSARSPRDGVFLEQLETDPAQYLPDPASVTADQTEVVAIDLNRPMAEIRAELAKYPVKTRLSLTGTDGRRARHRAREDRRAARRGRADARRTCATTRSTTRAPRRRPEGYASGSFGPTTAGRMDSYVERFQAAGGSLVMLAKGNRSAAVTAACKTPRRVLPRLDRRRGRAARAGLHHQG